MIDFSAPPRADIVFSTEELEALEELAELRRDIIGDCSYAYEQQCLGEGKLDTLPFLYTDTARLLLTRCELGVTLSEMAISHMSKEDSGIGVNGNPFTCFARSLCAPLAKKKDRRQQSDYVRIDPHATATTGDPPTDLLLYLGRSMPLKKLDYERVAGDQEVPSSVRHSDDCYSAEKNFVRELTWGNPNVIDIDGKKFVDKRYGVETALNLEPVEFRGVNVPPGFICRVSPEHDRGKKLHRVCRPSAFVFNEEVARRAFGRQLSRLGKAYVSDAFETFADLKARVL